MKKNQKINIILLYNLAHAILDIEWYCNKIVKILQLQDRIMPVFCALMLRFSISCLLQGRILMLLQGKIVGDKGKFDQAKAHFPLSYHSYG